MIFNDNEVLINSVLVNICVFVLIATDFSFSTPLLASPLIYFSGLRLGILSAGKWCLFYVFYSFITLLSFIIMTIIIIIIIIIIIMI